jgi:hypothetical protein
MVTRPSRQAKSYDEIKPLLKLCRSGRLFDVQAWIDDGRPVNPPPPPEKKARKKSPLQVAIDVGFHSLVQVFLEAGAAVTDGSFNALEQALFKRRLDLIKLLVAHGADIHSVDMLTVFETWDPAIMEFFIAQGADVETGYPLAGALCWRIRTALGVCKRHKERFPSFQDQLNVALRHHCRDGNLKWVSLLLWAGADPYAKGPESYGEDPDPEESLCALEYAAIHKHFDIFRLKQIRVPPDHPIAAELLRSACWAEDAGFLVELLDKGFNPADQNDGGSSLIQQCIQCLPWGSHYGWLGRGRETDIDSSRSRETLKMIHILAKHGTKWTPEERYEFNDARRALLRMKSDYMVELAWIMSKYKSCSRNALEQLLKTPTIRKHVAEKLPRINELLGMLPDEI